MLVKLGNSLIDLDEVIAVKPSAKAQAAADIFFSSGAVTTVNTSIINLEKALVKAGLMGDGVCKP